jgi:hypothetical protein
MMIGNKEKYVAFTLCSLHFMFVTLSYRCPVMFDSVYPSMAEFEHLEGTYSGGGAALSSLT